MRIHKIFATFALICTSISIVAAQMDCPTLVQTVIETVANACETVGNNQLCYGHPALTVVPRENAVDFTFEQSGDMANVADVQTLQLGAFNLSDETWGAAIMKLLVNPSVPESAVNFVALGDVTIENMGDTALVTARVNATNPINVRSDPTTQGAIVSILDPNTTIAINGRNAAGDWVHVLLDEGTTGWVAASLLQSDTDFSSLNMIDSDRIGFAPMQAITIQTSRANADCAAVPASGVLIQTPVDSPAIQLEINVVVVELSGTAFVQAEAGNGLFIHVLQGSATVSAMDTSVVVPAGATSLVPIGESLYGSDAPARPAPYELEMLQTLPLQLLPHPVELIEPLTQREINAQNSCRVVALTEGASFREGPGTAYFAKGVLIPDNPYLVYGRADGRDGYLWWYVTGGRWVRADIVTASGNCEDVEIIDVRPAQPSTSGVSTNTTCTFERIVYAEAGTTIPIVSEYVSSAVPVGAIIATITVDGTVIYEGQGTQHGVGLQWTTSWVATQGIHNVEALYTPTIQITPDWANNPFEPGESWSFAVCQIRVE